MLAGAEVMPTIPVVDLDRARRFYEGTLGLVPAGPPSPDGIRYRCANGTQLFLFPRAATQADHTVATFIVEDIEAAVAGLRARGVVFMEYDVPGLRTMNGIATLATERAAWFADTEGNVLAVSQWI